MLPVGLLGIMLAAYFSAILSTADSCLMAASGNVNTDLFPAGKGKKSVLRSQLVTLGLGTAALILASQMTSVLDLMLQSYAFMVSGLIVPTIALLVLPNPSSKAALGAMLVGGCTTTGLMFAGWALPLGLDANIFGISAALIVFTGLQSMTPAQRS
jgi:SSS family solute:Na+ symporter